MLGHGLGASSEYWRRVVPELSRSFRVVSYDLRGCGRSGKPPGPYSLDGLVDDLATLVETLGLERPSVVGASMSGAISLEYAARHPDSVRAIVGVGTVTELPDEGRDGMRARADTVRAEGMAGLAETVAATATAASWQAANPDELQAFRAALAANDPEAYAALALVVAELDLSASLPRVTAPVLLVTGDSDYISTPAANRANVARLSDASYVEIPDCGHIVPIEKPRELADAIVSFLQGRA